MPNTNVLTSLANLSPCLIGETGVFASPAIAFSSEVATGSREENASKVIKSQIGSPRADLALALRGLARQSSVAAERLLARG
jgi:hypothetical protein